MQMVEGGRGEKYRWEVSRARPSDTMSLLVTFCSQNTVTSHTELQGKWEIQPDKESPGLGENMDFSEQESLSALKPIPAFPCLLAF
jgi:hypothetical protein